MKPCQRKPQIIYRVINKQTGEPASVWNSATVEETDFYSEDEAKYAHPSFQDAEAFEIVKYKVIYRRLK